VTKNIAGFAHLLILVVTLAIGIGAWWLYSQISLPGPSTNERYYVANKEQCALIEYDCPEGYQGFSDEKGCGCEMFSPTINEIEISSWNTYTNEEYRFSFKHPHDWTINETNNRIEIQDNSFEPELPFNISVEELYQNKENFINDLIDLSKKKYETVIERNSQLQIGKLDTLRIDHYTDNFITTELYGFNINRPEEYIAVSFLNPTIDKTRINLIKQFLPTFEFID
jgi:hypothetical protein